MQLTSLVLSPVICIKGRLGLHLRPSSISAPSQGLWAGFSLGEGGQAVCTSQKGEKCVRARNLDKGTPRSRDWSGPSKGHPHCQHNALALGGNSSGHMGPGPHTGKSQQPYSTCTSYNRCSASPKAPETNHMCPHTSVIMGAKCDVNRAHLVT